jgi:2-C-methyl-D-erythritol 2,4-cyclodiphosphate synthase
MRIGFGTDTHALISGRALIIGGVHIPHEKGLDGHSDADVLAHAISDALLGAAGLGDIGRHFPDSDAAYKGADSIKLMQKVYAMIEGGYAIENIDATVLAQAPKLAPHIPAMQARIADALGIDRARVNIKASTTEHLGFEGREEGISAQAVCLLAEVE